MSGIQSLVPPGNHSLRSEHLTWLLHQRFPAATVRDCISLALALWTDARTGLEKGRQHPLAGSISLSYVDPGVGVSVPLLLLSSLSSFSNGRKKGREEPPRNKMSWLASNRDLIDNELASHILYLAVSILSFFPFSFPREKERGMEEEDTRQHQSHQALILLNAWLRLGWRLVS